MNKKNKIKAIKLAKKNYYWKFAYLIDGGKAMVKFYENQLTEIKQPKN